MIDFKDIGIADKSQVDKLLQKAYYNSSDYCFTTLFIWRDFFKIKIAFLDDFLLIKYGPSRFNFFKTSYLFPVGDMSRLDTLKSVIDHLIEQAKEEKVPFKMQYVLKEQTEILDKLYPEKFTYEEDRDNFDYLYNSQDLIFLHGKKFQGKRNHLSRFKELHDWSYDVITSENLQECYDMNKEWCKRYGCIYDSLKEDESCAVVSALRHFEQLGLNGGLLRVEGKVIAFTIGEHIGTDSIIVHVEKAFSDINGAYPAISAMFLRSMMRDAHYELPSNSEQILSLLEGKDHNTLIDKIGFKYVNREDDAGNEGLREAKLQYHPAFLLQKFCVKEK